MVAESIVESIVESIIESHCRVYEFSSGHIRFELFVEELAERNYIRFELLALEFVQLQT